MIHLGVLSQYQATPYITKIAQHAAKNNVSLSIFSPSQLTSEDNLLNGLHYNMEKEEWEESHFPIPSLIYDRCFYSSRKIRPYQAYINKLKQHPTVHFLGYGLPDKWKVYEALSSSEDLKAFFPKTKKLTSATFFLSHLKPHETWLLKPIKGSQGRGIIKVIVKQKHYVVKEVRQPGEQLFSFTYKQLQSWLHTRMKKTEYIFQPFLPLQNKHGFPFDIRLLIQKDEKGNWQERIRAIRTGLRNHITSNLAGGGKMLPFSSLTKGLTSTQKHQIEANIRKIIESLPKKLEDNFQPLFEIGLDLGMDTSLNLWILDINSKPGHKIVSMAPSSVQQKIYEAPSKYCCYLASSLGTKLGVDTYESTFNNKM